MDLEQKDIDANDINFSSNGKDEGQPQDAKTAEADSEQTECKTVLNSITHRFKPKKRRMGNLILKSNCLVTAENEDVNARESDAEYEYTNRTIGKTVSGILSKFFHSKRTDSFRETSEESGSPEYSNLRLHDDLGESRTTRNKWSRVFETYRKRNGLQEQPKDERYYNSNSEGEKSFNRFYKLEQALDAKRDEKNLRSMNDETEGVSYTSKDLSLGSTVLDNSQEICTENGTFVPPGSKGKSDTQFIINDSPKTESAVLENTVFSPNSHRPSLRDIPGIENIEISSSDQNTWKQSYFTFRMAFKIKPVKSILNERSSKPQKSQFKSLDDEIDSHLYYQSRTNLLSRCFPNKNYINQNIKRESQNENIDFAPEMEERDKQTPSIPTSPNSLSENLTAIKGILLQKYKSSFSRDKSKRQNLSVKFVSPTLSPIEMTNNEINDNGHNDTEIISQTTC